MAVKSQRLRFPRWHEPPEFQLLPIGLVFFAPLSIPADALKEGTCLVVDNQRPAAYRHVRGQSTTLIPPDGKKYESAVQSVPIGRIDGWTLRQNTAPLHFRKFRVAMTDAPE